LPSADRNLIRRIYYLHYLMVGPAAQWSAHLTRCREMGFDCVAVPPLFAPGRSGDVFLAGDVEAVHSALIDPTEGDSKPGHVVGELVAACRAQGLALVVDVMLDRVDAIGRVATSHPDLFHTAPADALPDPRKSRPPSNIATARFDEPFAAKRLVTFWATHLRGLLQSGIAGFRFLNPQSLRASLWCALVDALRSASQEAALFAWTPGMPWTAIRALAPVGFDGVFSSLPWWDRRATWLAEELDLLRRVAPIIACPEAPFGPRLQGAPSPAVNISATYRQALRIAAATGDGLLVPMGFEFGLRAPMDARRSTPEDFSSGTDIDLGEDIRASSLWADRIHALGTCGEARALNGPHSPITAIMRFDAADARGSERASVLLINPSFARQQPIEIALDPLPPVAGAALGDPCPIDAAPEPAEQLPDPAAPLAPGEVRVVAVTRIPPVAPRQRPALERCQLTLALEAPRIVIDAIAPAVEGGRFPTKRVTGEPIAVTADIYCDGHGVLSADLLWKAIDEKDWQRVAMRAGVNDRWQADFVSGRIGRHIFTVEAWADAFATVCRDLDIKRRAGLGVALEIAEARELIEAAPGAGSILEQLSSADETAAIELLLTHETAARMRQSAPRPHCLRHEPAIPLEIERPQAAFAAWYELFPRSTSPIAGRHGTLTDVIARLPDIRAMGFDVLYLPPLHPIGRTHRKGRNNSPSATPDDPGSPYAIGAREGGHDAIHPDLGTFEDFHRLLAAAVENGLEIAVDFAIQCSPDHPWLAAHPQWFRRRPDGSLRYAENPPKKYEDIVNVEFYADGAASDLWMALRDFVLFWIGHGVHIFRVDNPHTKPLPFWEWLIADVRARYPDVIFLAEAFTRPKMMHRLAKIGFSQSYTYFTWRNTKRELTEYLTELAATTDYFRPHFFVNTPDINPYFLQRSGRAGFLIRAVLAATLSPLWGVYSGFELCEAEPLPGREEYLNAEKYEIKQRDYGAAGNIKAEIATLNRIRRTNPALQRQSGLTFYNAFNDDVMAYGKATAPRRDMIFVVVNLDPHHSHDVTFELPLWEWGISDNGALDIEDLIGDRRFVLSGKLQRLRLDPERPYVIWRMAPVGEAQP
jgi:starch synthase (maltosyl-transferring)